jgi:hypothetical protein
MNLRPRLIRGLRLPAGSGPSGAIAQLLILPFDSRPLNREISQRDDNNHNNG